MSTLVRSPSLTPPILDSQSLFFQDDEDLMANYRPYIINDANTQVSVLSEETGRAARKVELAPVRVIRKGVPRVVSQPIEIWEGTVLSVDQASGNFDACLVAKLSDTPRHTGTFSFEWVSTQDIDLIESGAVFYLTLYKESERSSVRNAQEIRFRRMPSWSDRQIRNVNSLAVLFASNIEA